MTQRIYTLLHIKSFNRAYLLHSTEFSLEIYNQRCNSIWSKDVSNHKIFINNKWLQFWLLHLRTLYVHIQYNVDTRARVHTKCLHLILRFRFTLLLLPAAKNVSDRSWMNWRQAYCDVSYSVGGRGLCGLCVNFALLKGIMYLLIH